MNKKTKKSEWCVIFMNNNKISWYLFIFQDMRLLLLFVYIKLKKKSE